MEKEKSCGAMVINDGKVLLVHQTNDVWCFPKGHMEDGETEIETALREIKEETNLDVNILDGFKTIEEHTFFKDSEERLKHVTYFIGEYENQEFKKQEEEVSDIKLMDYEEAMESFQYDNSRRVLKEVEDYLNNKER